MASFCCLKLLLKMQGGPFTAITHNTIRCFYNIAVFSQTLSCRQSHCNRFKNHNVRWSSKLAEIQLQSKNVQSNAMSTASCSPEPTFYQRTHAVFNFLQARFELIEDDRFEFDFAVCSLISDFYLTIYQ